MIGEEEASHLGVNLRNLQRMIILINVITVATATAFVGVISFVGLIVPHLLRLSRGRTIAFADRKCGVGVLC